MSSSPDETISNLITRIEAGDKQAADELIPLVYDDLRQLARNLYYGDAQARTMNPTALVHEAFVRLRGSEFEGRRHFLGAASIAMRRLLTDNARAQARDKRGGKAQRMTLQVVDDRALGSETMELDLIDLEAALEKLSKLHERQARVVEMRFLAGLSVEETAAILGVSDRTAKTDWKMARAWLSRELDGK